MFVFSIGDFGALGEIALINGTPQSKMLQLHAGKKYRFRFINISTNNQGMQVSLRKGDDLANWTVIAKDGADLPPDQVQTAKAQFTITVGETRDVRSPPQTPRTFNWNCYYRHRKSMSCRRCRSWRPTRVID